MGDLGIIKDLIVGIHQICEDVEEAKRAIKVADEKLQIMVPLLDQLQDRGSITQKNSEGHNKLVDDMCANLTQLEDIARKARKMNKILYIVKASSIHSDINKTMGLLQFTMSSITVHYTIGIQNQNDSLHNQVAQFQDQWERHAQEMKQVFAQEKQKSQKFLSGNMPALVAEATNGSALEMQELYQAAREEQKALLLAIQESQDSKAKKEEVYVQQIIAAIEEQTEKDRKEHQLQKNQDNVPDCVLCPISYQIMTDPVTLHSNCSHAFQRSSIQEWMDRGNHACPMCSQPMRSPQLFPNAQLRDVISSLKLAEQNPDETAVPKEWKCGAGATPINKSHIKRPSTSIQSSDEAIEVASLKHYLKSLASKPPATEDPSVTESTEHTSLHSPNCFSKPDIEETKLNGTESDPPPAVARYRWWWWLFGGVFLILALLVGVVVMAIRDFNRNASDQLVEVSSTKPAPTPDTVWSNPLHTTNEPTSPPQPTSVSPSSLPSPVPRTSATATINSKAELSTAIDNWISSSGSDTTYGPAINDWDVSRVSDFSGLFESKSTFNDPINDWQTSQVTDMNSMFQDASAFNQPLNNWDVSKVTYLYGMFRESSFNQDINSWNVGSAVSMGSMFYGTSSFNQPLSGWNVSKVTNFGWMFREASFNQDISNWDVDSAKNMNHMFYLNNAFNQDLCAWGTHLFGSGAYVNFMFASAISCPSTSNPNLGASPVSPLCYVC